MNKVVLISLDRILIMKQQQNILIKLKPFELESY